MQSCSSIDQTSLMPDVIEDIQSNADNNTINSSIFQNANSKNYKYHSLFEDHHPHTIGDVITIVLQENINASNSSFSNHARNGNLDIGLANIPNQMNPMTDFHLNTNKMGLYGTGKNFFSGKGNNSAKNSFTGIIAVTVQKIFPNGNLGVVGDKKVFINHETEFIRFSGIINPDNINKNNLISSTQIADTHIEYLSNGATNDAKNMGWLQKLFLKFSPV
jgi:flagellar L-ring protein precursor FlgH